MTISALKNCNSASGHPIIIEENNISSGNVAPNMGLFWAEIENVPTRGHDPTGSICCVPYNLVKKDKNG